MSWGNPLAAWTAAGVATLTTSVVVGGGGGVVVGTAPVVGVGAGASKLTKAESLGVPQLDRDGFLHLLETGELPGGDAEGD